MQGKMLAFVISIENILLVTYDEWYFTYFTIFLQVSLQQNKFTLKCHTTLAMINLDLSITVHACCFALGIIITIACLSLPANIASPVKLQQLYFSFPSFCHHLTCYSSIKEHFSGAFIDIFIIFQTFTAFRELLRICTKTNGVNSPHLLMYGIFPSLFKLWPVSIYAELEGNAPTQMQTYLIC